MMIKINKNIYKIINLLIEEFHKKLNKEKLIKIILILDISTLFLYKENNNKIDKVNKWKYKIWINKILMIKIKKILLILIKNLNQL